MMIDFRCKHFRKEDGCRWCDKFNHFMCELCHEDEDDYDNPLDRIEY